MKKIYTLLLLCLAGTLGAWAEDTYESVYSKVLADWSDDDKTDWNASGAVEVNTTNGIGANNNQTATYLSKSFSVADGSKIKYEVDWTFATATGRANNWNWIQFGSFLRLAVNSSYNMQVSTDAGTTWSETTLGYYSNGTYTKHIEVIFNTQTNTVEQLSFDGTDRTSLVTGSFNNATFNTVSTGFVRDGSVSWTLNNYITNITVSEAQQAAAAEASYTINYRYNEEVIKSVNGTHVVGGSVYAESPITVDNTRYYAADGVTTSLTVTADETTNVLDVELREPYTKTVSINAVDKDGNVLKTFSTECVEGEAAKNLFYTRAVEKNGKYYTIPAANTSGTNYGKSVSFTSSDENKEYTLDETITYYAEESNLNVTRSYAAQGQVSERASGGNWQRLYANSYAYTAALPAGAYKVDISGRSQSASSNVLDIEVRLADGTLVETGNSATWGNAICSVQTFEDIVVPDGASIAIVNNSGDGNGTYYNTNVALDYIIVYKTGEAITIPNNENGLGSYVTTDALVFSGVDGLKAYVATAEKTDKVVVTQVSEVPAGTPIFVRGTAGETYAVPVGSCTTAPQGNLLQGNATTGYTVADGEKVYALKASTGMLTPVTAGVTIPAKKAYLVSTIGSASAKLSVVYAEDEEEEATAVNAVEAAAQTGVKRLFNAAGQQVGIGYKGLVIDESGKKYVRK